MTAANNNFDPDELLTEVQLSEISKHSPRTFQGWRIKGTGPRFVKNGRSVRYRYGDYIKWITENTARSTAEVDARS